MRLKQVLDGTVCESGSASFGDIRSQWPQNWPRRTTVDVVVSTGEHGASRLRAHARLRKAVLEQRAVLCKCIDVGRLDHRVSCASEAVVSQLVLRACPYVSLKPSDGARQAQ